MPRRPIAPRTGSVAATQHPPQPSANVFRVPLSPCMPMDSIVSVPASRYEEAIAQVMPSYRRAMAAAAIATLHREGRLPDGCMHAVQHASGHYTAALLAIPAAGRTASFVLTPPGLAYDVPQAAALLTVGVAKTATWPVDLLQALLDPTDEHTHAAYMQAGFQHLAELHTMVAPIPRRSTPTPLPNGITLRHTHDANLIAVLDATYAETMDCPSLRGLRQTPDIVEGHRSCGRVHDDLWIVIARDQRDIGCALTTCTDEHSADLAYFGLIPEVRGHGLGRIVMEHVHARAAAHDVRTMRLAVDADNAPACRLYRSLGFVLRSKQSAVIRSAADVQV